MSKLWNRLETFFLEVPPEKPEWFSRYELQKQYELEGATACFEGKTTADCPYDEATSSMAWNHWVYGCSMAASERAIIDSGEVQFYNETSDKPIMVMPVTEAVKNGLWKAELRKSRP